MVKLYYASDVSCQNHIPCFLTYVAVRDQSQTNYSLFKLFEKH